MFVKLSNIVVKAMLDRQPLLGTGPLPVCLHNLTHGRKIVALDTINREVFERRAATGSGRFSFLGSGCGIFKKIVSIRVKTLGLESH